MVRRLRPCPGHGLPSWGSSGSGGYDKVNNFLYANLGAQVQLGDLGATLSGEFLRYIVHSASSSANLTLTSGRYHALVAYGLANDQFVIGAGLRAASLQLSQSNSLVPTKPPSILTMTGAAPEVGLLVKPNDLPFRVGATVRAPVNGSTFGTSSGTVDAQGTTRAGSLALPTQITLPWELEAGFAVQVGPRPLNPSWINPHEQESRVRNNIADERARRERRNEEIVTRANRRTSLPERPGLIVGGVSYALADLIAKIEAFMQAQNDALPTASPMPTACGVDESTP